MLVKILILILLSFLIYHLVFGSELVEGFQTKILSNIDDLNDMQQRQLISAIASLRIILRDAYIKGNIDDNILIEQKKEINKLASKAATKIKNAISENKNTREVFFPIGKEYLLALSNLMGNDIDTKKIPWLN